MSSALRYQPHYTYQDYLHWEGDWELWGGTAVAMSPSPFGIHERAVTRLSHLLMSGLENSDCFHLPAG